MANKPETPVAAASPVAVKKSVNDRVKDIQTVAQAHHDVVAERLSDLVKSDLEVWLLAQYLLLGESGAALSREQKAVLKDVPLPE